MRAAIEVSPTYYGGITCYGGVTDYGGNSYPWSGNTNVVAMFIAEAEHITLAGADVASLTTQQAYTAGGSPTTYTWAQSDTGLDPVWEPSGFNGRGSVRGDGTEWMGTPDLHGFIQGDTSFIVVTVFQQLTNANNDRLWSAANTANNTDFHEFYDDSIASSYSSFRRGGGTTREITSSAAPDTSRHIWTVRFVADGTDQVAFYQDGNVDTALTNSDITVGTLNNTTLFGRRVNSTSGSLLTDMRVRAQAWIQNDDTDAMNAIHAHFASQL